MWGDGNSTRSNAGVFKSRLLGGIEVGYGTKKPGGHAYHSYQGVQEVNGGP